METHQKGVLHDLGEQKTLNYECLGLSEDLKENRKGAEGLRGNESLCGRRTHQSLWRIRCSSEKWESSQQIEQGAENHRMIIERLTMETKTWRTLSAGWRSLDVIGISQRAYPICCAFIRVARFFTFSYASI